MKLVLWLLLFTGVALAQTTSLKLNFTPESEKFAEAVKAYEGIWASEHAKIVRALETAAGLQFTDQEVKVIVYEGVSWSGFGDKPMKLRASYPPDVKKATLIHELGHRLLSRLPETAEIDAHRALFLILYDVWVKLYGKEFADQNVAIEKRRKGIYDYEAAWNWTLALSEQARSAKFKEFVRTSAKRN
jgi:hypothetical protein